MPNVSFLYHAKVLFLIIILFYLASCGFHLRGSVSLNIQSVFIEEKNARLFANEIKRLLKEQQVKVTEKPQHAQVILALEDAKFDRRVLTISAVSSRIEEVELSLRLKAEIRQADDTVLLEKQRLHLMREYSFDEMAMLAMSAEEETLKEELFEAMVAQLMRMLSAVELKKSA